MKDLVDEVVDILKDAENSEAFSLQNCYTLPNVQPNNIISRLYPAVEFDHALCKAQTMQLRKNWLEPDDFGMQL